MDRLYLPKSLSILLLIVAVPLIAWSLVEICIELSCLGQQPPMDQAALTRQSILLRALGVVITLAAVLAGGIVWRRRLNRGIDDLVEACRNMALGEPSPLPDSPRNLEDLNRLILAIQVMHEALLDYLSLYRRFFDTSPDMFLTLAPAGQRIMEANLSFCRAVNRLKDEVLGQPVDRFLSLDKSWEQALSEGGELITGQIKGPEGTIKVEVNISLERGPEGQPWVLGAILRDVTLRDALHDELLKKSTALEKALEEIKTVEELKDEFLTTLSHELKTPLVSLKGFLQLLRQGQLGSDEAINYLEICWRNLNKLEKQINNLLDLARLSHSKTQYEMGQVDIAGLVRTAVENLQPFAAEREVTIIASQIPASPVPVKGNTSKLIQLIDNLLINAIKYNKEQGEVNLALAPMGDKVVFSVSDSGVGIEREHMAAIFNRFYRADISGTGRLEGLGIGLSLVQEIVKLHDGEIRVESDPGAGTTFTVTLGGLG